MNTRTLATALAGLVIVTSGCHKSPPPTVAPTPPVIPAPPPPVTQTSVPNNTGNRVPDNSGTPVDANAARMKILADLGEKIHFAYDKSDIATADEGVLDRKAAIMRTNAALKIRIVGHCDERGSDSYNIALGMRRASAAKDYLVRKGANAANIEIASLGRESPEDPSGTESAMAKNRRDEFEATAGAATLAAPRP